MTTAKLTNLWLIQTLVGQICSNLVNEISQIRKRGWGWVVCTERGYTQKQKKEVRDENKYLFSWERQKG